MSFLGALGNVGLFVGNPGQAGVTEMPQGAGLVLGTCDPPQLSPRLPNVGARLVRHTTQARLRSHPPVRIRLCTSVGRVVAPSTTGPVALSGGSSRS